ncbi:MAG: protein BatD [Fibrobacteres bacterium]|nr:protein BatD [Fibrobacterota bacterium]
MRLTLALCLTLLAAGAARAEIAAQASLTASQVGTGEPFQLIVQVTSDEKPADLPWPQVEGLQNFTVAKNMANSQSSQTTIVNGRVSSKNLYIVNFTYTLTAHKPGAFQLGPIKYAYKDYERNMGSAQVTVAKQEPGLTSTPTLSKRKAYVGEQVFYNLRLVAGAGVQQINLVQDLQKLIGEKFWFQRLDKQVEGKTMKINGENARVYDMRIVLFPLLAGKADLAGIPIEYTQASRTQRRRQGSVFDMFDDEFFGNGGSAVNMSAMASPIDMEVLPLPAGAPDGFTGSVGIYSLSATVDKTSVAAGDAVTLTVTVKGDGEPKTITKPKLPDLGQFEVFEPEVATNSAPQGNTLITVKTFKYVMVPHRRGDYDLGAIAFPYFDPERKEYVEAKSQPIRIAVTAGKESEYTPARVMSQREIADIGSDIRHIKTSGELKSQDDFVYRRAWYWLLFPPTPVAFAMLLLVRTRSRRLAADATFKRKTLAGPQLKRRLREAEDSLKQRDARGFYRALSQAVVGFASDKTNVEFRGLTVEDAQARLKANGAGEAAATEYAKVLQACDFGQFGGGERDEKAWKAALAAAENLLRILDRELG